QFLANLLALRRTHRFLQLFVELVEVDLGEKFLNRFSAHTGDEIFAVLFLRLAVFNFIQQLCFLQWRLARIDDDVVFVVDHALKLTRAHVQHKPDARRHAFVEPDVRNRHRQLYVSHAFTADARECDFDTAPIADHALMLDALVFSARTLPIAGRPKNPLAEKSALLRFKRAVINCLRILDFAFAPRAHGVARGDANCDLIKTYWALFAH